MSPEMDKVITIVSGLPRSGTSMMMKMLKSGGMKVVSDNIRTADEDNPNGYYEFEKVKRIKEDTSWLEETHGKVFKMVSMLLFDLPPRYLYKIIFMNRDLQEIVVSQKKMLTRQGKQPATDNAKMSELYEKHLLQVEKWHSTMKNIQVMHVSFRNLIRQPFDEVKRLNQFLGKELYTDKMVQVIDPSLYRNRIA
jgi:hypothetical protein